VNYFDPITQWFKVTDYLEKIKRPMTLQNIRDNVQKKKYHSREEFLSDVNQVNWDLTS